MSAGMIFDIQRFAIHDGPGIRTLVFLKGCPLSCWWCHNPEGVAAGVEMMLRENRCIRCGACVEACPHGAISWNGQGPVTDRSRCERCATCETVCHAEARQAVGRRMEAGEVVAEVERDLPFYAESGGGVTFSGGEPLAQPEFLGELLARCRARGIHTALDTCGYAGWEVLDALRGSVDLFLYDLKVLDAGAHRRFTGVPNDGILSNLRELCRRGHTVVVRVPLIAGVNDDPADLGRLGAFVAGLAGPPRVDLLPGHRIGADKYARLDRTARLAAPSPPPERLAQAQELLHGLGLAVSVGG